MMSGSSRPRGSEGTRLVLIAVCLVLLAGVVRPAAAGPPVLRLGPDGPGDDRTTGWLREDVAWLSRLPEASLLPPAWIAAAGPEAGVPVADLAAELRRRVAGVATDSVLVLRTAESRLAERWRARGYLAVTITRRPGARVDADRVRPDTLVVAPGPVWTLGTVSVDGEDFSGRSHLLGTWLPRTGERFDAAEFSRGIDQVLAGAGEAGYPWARWVTRAVISDDTARTVDVDAVLLAGRRTWLGPLTTSLPPGRAADFAVRASGLRPGALFRQSDLQRARDRLLARDLYAQVGEPLVHLTTADDTVGVSLPLVPRRRNNRLQVVLGLSRRDEGASRLSGQVNLSLPNMAGTGRALDVDWRDDGNGASRFGFSYLEPLFLGTPLDTDIAVDNEVRRDQYTRFRLDNRWRLPVVALWGVELGFGWDRSTFPTGTLESTSRVRGRGAFYHRRGDRTRSGWEGLFALEEARRSSRTRVDTTGFATGAQLGEAVSQRIFEVDVSGELRLGPTLGLFGRAAFRELSGGPEEVPLAEHFRFGGAATLRGYREEEFHGTRASWGAVELRVGRPTGSRLYTFWDLGYFAYATRETLPDGSERPVLREGWPRGYGLGILARSRAGDISLAIGFPGTVDFDLAKLHVTLLESF